MLMSKSRLEKFLYALYSLDSSDLPNPLSRIEGLYKCLVTGEEPPTFEPLSRVEKYLMAILGVYDVDSLPNPLSRVEVLLHKLATGDDNLDDVKSFLSEHEELLAEIIRNGGIGENIDIEYVLYTLSTEFNTLYNTAEKPVKSAILKGQTLVNLIKNPSEIKVVGKSTATLAKYEVNYLDNTKNYTVLFKISDYVGSGNITISLGTSSTGITQEVNKNGIYKFLIPSIRIGSEMNEFWIYWAASNWTDGNSANISDIVLIEGDYTNVDIPYFEGMQSVKMSVLTTTGKNLFDINHFSKLENWDGKTSSERPYYAYEMKLKPNTSYTFSRKENSTANNIYFCISKKQGVYDWSGGIIHPTDTTAIYQQRTVTTDSTGILYFNLYQAHNELVNLIPLLEDTQLEEGSVATSYEPYKSNILTVNEEVELRRIGDVKDELNLLTGELTQRIGEVVLDGSDDLAYNYEPNSNDTTTMVHIPIPNTDKIFNFYNDRLTLEYVYDATCVIEGVFADWNGLFIRLLNSKLSSPNSYGVKEYFKSDPLRVQYQLATSTIKTVVLSVVDQDGNNTELSTFDDITHVTLSSEGLISGAELEVATKNEEVLNTTSLEMDDISTTQNALQETSNGQSENIDSTMLATTEIYEQLL